MPYSSVIVKEDEGVREKYLYLCITKGCGAQINDFPIALKDPSPKWCKDCAHSKETRELIEKEWLLKT